ncbi:MAG: CHAD domain-containing protein [Phycisphaerae bacterium]|nr:CHAD domain-containing protein [Phycisphaerae bacterium]
MSGGKARKSSHGLSADTLFHDAASVILRRRLQTVADAVERLRKSHNSSRIQPDDIHQVRVSVRRASAAISVFGGCVDAPRRLSKTRMRLRDMRRAIGTTRSCDVSLSILEHDRETADPAQRAGIERLEAALRRKRDQSLREVRRAVRRCSPDRLRKWGRKLAASTVEVPGGDSEVAACSLGEAARSALGALLSDIRRYGSMDLQQAETLHELRLAAKRLRYATEVFGPCFEPERLDEATDLLVLVQDRLGIANDLSEIVNFIRRRIEKEPTQASYPLLLATYSRRFDETRADFISWWRHSGDHDLAHAYRGLAARLDPAHDPTDTVLQPLSRVRIAPITQGVNGSRA